MLESVDQGDQAVSPVPTPVLTYLPLALISLFSLPVMLTLSLSPPSSDPRRSSNHSVKQADSKPGNIRRSKRSKLYAYRDQPEKLLPAIQAVKDGRRIKVEAGTAFA